MKLITLAAFAAGAVLMQRMLRAQRAAAASEPSALGPRADDADANEGDETFATATDLGATTNAGEQLVDDGLAGSAQDGNLFGSNSQEGEQPVTPGLPDLTRGA